MIVIRCRVGFSPQGRMCVNKNVLLRQMAWPDKRHGVAFALYMVGPEAVPPCACGRLDWNILGQLDGENSVDVRTTGSLLRGILTTKCSGFFCCSASSRLFAPINPVAFRVHPLKNHASYRVLVLRWACSIYVFFLTKRISPPLLSFEDVSCCFVGIGLERRSVTSHIIAVCSCFGQQWLVSTLLNTTPARREHQHTTNIFFQLLWHGPTQTIDVPRTCCSHLVTRTPEKNLLPTLNLDLLASGVRNTSVFSRWLCPVKLAKSLPAGVRGTIRLCGRCC